MDCRFDFSGRIVLITGGTRGLGRAMALAFAGAGADVIVSSRKAAACKAVAAEIAALGVRSAGLAAHAGEWDEMTALADTAWDTFGRIDVLINNAGMSPVAPSSSAVTEALFDKVVGVNFKGAYRLSALVGERMVAAGGGAIINVSSTGALSPRPHFGPYAGAKAALNAMTVAMAREFAPTVRVNTISPGSFATDIAKGWDDVSRIAAASAQNRLGDPSEIVGAALYLASEAASYTSGANIQVDGCPA
jgi:NAD(P)-dependent dehydrogenase (short-subunit alcohol dehydrogenase family)